MVDGHTSLTWTCYFFFLALLIDGEEKYALELDTQRPKIRTDGYTNSIQHGIFLNNFSFSLVVVANLFAEHTHSSST